MSIQESTRPPHAPGAVIAVPPSASVSRRAALIVMLCALAYLLDGLTTSIMGTVAPGISRSLQLGPRDLGPVFSAGLLGQAVGLFFVSVLPLRFGHRPVVFVSVLAFGVFEALMAFAGTADQLLALRFLTGVGLGGALPSCMAVASEITPPERRGVTVMSVFVGYAVGNSAAGLLTAAFIGPDGWRSVLLIAGGACTAVAFAIFRWLPESPSYLASRATPRAVSAAARPKVRTLFAPVVLIGTMLLWTFYICAQLTSITVQSWLPIMLERTGREPTLAVLAITSFNLGGLLACLTVGWLMDRVNPIKVTFALQAAAAVTFLLCGGQLAEAGQVVLQLEMFVLGMFSLGAYGAINVVVTQHYPAELRSIGLGWAKGISRLGAIAGPVASGIALADGFAPQDIFRASSIPGFIGAVALAVLGLSVAGGRRRTTTNAPG